MASKQEQTYRLQGVEDEQGNRGTLKFTVKPGGNAHAEFEADTQSGSSGQPEDPQASQQPS